VCVSGCKFVDEVAMEWADQRCGDPEPIEFINDGVNQNGFKWECCGSRGNSTGCRRTRHIAKAELNAPLVKPLSSKRKADPKPQQPKKRQMVGDLEAWEEDEIEEEEKIWEEAIIQ
jgi:hypothetical protein